MPIEIRPSDVMGQVAETFRRTTHSLLGIRRDVYEAERVSQVNQGLAFFERAFQEYDQELDTRQFDVPLDDVEKGGATVKKSLGETDRATLEDDYANYVQTQLDYINKTVTNKQARQELIQHLEMGSIAHKGRVLNAWEQAADHAARASLEELYTTVMQSNASWEDKVGKISSRVDDMVRTGRLWKDEGEKIKQQAEVAAQYSHASNGTMDAMKNGFVYKDSDGKEHVVEPGMDAGEVWLNVNTPFYDGNPDARAKILSDVRREFDFIGRAADNELDRDFSTMYHALDSSKKCIEALAAVGKVEFYDADRKVYWTDKFIRERDYWLKMEEIIDPKAIEDWQKKYEDDLRAQMAIAKASGDVTMEAIFDMAIEARETTDIHGYAPRVRGSFMEWAQKYTKSEDDPVVKGGLKLITSKTAGLDDKEKYRVTNDFMRWLETHSNASQQDIENAANNFADPVVMRNLEGWGRATWAVLWGDEKTLDPYELLTRDIEAGLYAGIAEMRQKNLAIYLGYLVGKAQSDYPKENIVEGRIDFQGYSGGEPGTAILISGSLNEYAYKLEGKQLVLYGLKKDDKGEYVWNRFDTPVEKKKVEKAKVKLEKKEKTETERRETSKAVEELFEGKTAELNLDDWRKEKRGWATTWINKETGKEADVGTIMTLNRLQMFRDRGVKP